MRYAKLSTPNGPMYAFVEERQGVLWAAASMPFPEEDPLPALDPTVFRPAPLATFDLLAPVRPSKIICVGRNYRDHVAELGNDLPKEPLIFFKPPSSLLAPGGVVILPELSNRVDFEGELAIVIARRCRNLHADDDLRPYIRGYVVVNDVTARDLQKTDGQWARAKGFDTFCPCGPFVSDEIDPAYGEPVTVTTHLNGELRQTGVTSDLIFPIPVLLAYITAAMTLEAGDLIPTGTPSGVAPMQNGDQVQVAIAGLGVLTNPVATRNDR